MAGKTRDLLVRINGDTKGLEKALGRSGKGSRGLGAAFEKAKTGSFALLRGLTAAGLGAAAFGVKSVAAYNASVEASTKLRTNMLNVKGATLEQVASMEKLASKMQGYGVIEDDVIKAGMSQLATFNLQSKTIQGLTPKIADMVTQLKGHNATAEDMVTINNLVGKVMTGNVGSLSRYGVTLDETQKKILQNGTETEKMNTLNKVLAQNYGEVNKALRNTPQGQLTAFKNTFGDFMEVVGAFVSNLVTPLITGFNNWMASMGGPEGMMQALTNGFKKLVPYLPIIAGAILGGLVPAFIAMAGSAIAALAPLLPFIAAGALLAVVAKKVADKMGGWGALFDKVKDAAKGVWNAIKLLITGDFSGGIFGLSEDSAAIDWLFRFRDAAIELGIMVKDTLVGAFNTFKEVLAFLMPSLEALWNTIATNLMPALVNLWNTVSPVLIPALKTLGIIIGGVVVGAIWVIINVLNLWYKALSVIINVFSTLFGVVRSVVGGIIGAITGLYNFLSPIFKAIFAVAKFQFQAIYLAVAVVISLIMAVVKPIAGFIGNIFKKGWQIATGVWKGIYGFFSGIVKTIGNALSGVFNTITAPFKKAFDWVKDIPGKIVGAVGNIGKLLKDKLGDWDIPGPLGKVRDVIPGFAKGVRNFQGGLAVVGEEGPELVNLPKGSDVIPNGQIPRGFRPSSSVQIPQPVNQTIINFDPRIQIGMFAGMPTEYREIAERMWIEFQNIAKSNGVNLQQIGVRSQ